MSEFHLGVFLCDSRGMIELDLLVLVAFKHKRMIELDRLFVFGARLWGNNRVGFVCFWLPRIQKSD